MLTFIPPFVQSGGTRVRLQYRPPEKERLLEKLKERSVCDALGRLRLTEGRRLAFVEMRKKRVSYPEAF